MTELLSASKTQSPLPSEPVIRDEIARWVRDVLGMRIPDKSICPSHRSPLDYLAASFLDSGGDSADRLVWANRGGGKTMLAAIASLLDALYKAPINIRILGGSFDQSDRLADYLRNFLSGDLGKLVAGRITRQRIRLTGGADIRMLSQSQRAVRGQHAQKIRCDEVDLFDPDVWKAIQFTTRSSDRTRGGIEIFSTLHRAGGLMEQLVEQARKDVGGFEMFNWCIWEVIEKCKPPRRCDNCPLSDDCQGKARRADGFFRIDDAIAIKARSSRNAWEAEMLCLGAKNDWLVFGEFDHGLHVADLEYCPDWPTYRAIDFGYTSPLVCLWIQITPAGVVHVIDEYARARRSVAQHAVGILAHNPAAIVTTYVDPAGNARESTSGAACTELLASAGIRCCWRVSTVNEGLELIRAALAPATGPARLKIDRKCRGLIEAFRTYHYPLPGSSCQTDRPVKDGPDHFIDALRYFFVNRMRPKISVSRKNY
ncbi:MAG: hypothetical protein SVV80_13450 [Planctomycetota bacterium]|nr:hypothetical protein [Planctomycetota bacterium]